MSQSFEHALLAKLEAAFDEGETESLCRVRHPGDDPFAIKVIHKPTGHECTCEQYESQIKNKAMALADLLGRLRRAT